MLPGGMRRGGERVSLFPSHTEGEQSEEGKHASCWLPHSAQHSAVYSAGTQVFINFDKKKFPSAF